MKVKHIFFRGYIGFYRRRYRLIYYRANLEDWDKGSMGYKCPQFGESIYWMLDGLNHGQWQRRYINGNPWLERFFCANTGLPSPCQ